MKHPIHEATFNCRMAYATERQSPYLEALSWDSSEYVRAQVAANCNTPQSVLDELLSDPSAEVRAGLASNPSFSVDRLAGDPSPVVRHIVAELTRNPETLHFLYDPWGDVEEEEGVVRAVAANPHTPHMNLLVLCHDKREYVQRAALANPATTADWASFALHENWEVRSIVARRADVSPYVLAALGRDREYYVRLGVAANPSAPKSTLTNLLQRDVDQDELCTYVRYNLKARGLDLDE